MSMCGEVSLCIPNIKSVSMVCYVSCIVKSTSVGCQVNVYSVLSPRLSHVPHVQLCPSTYALCWSVPRLHC